MLLHFSFPTVGRETVTQHPQEAFKTIKPRVFNGVIVIVFALCVHPFAVFGVIPVKSPDLLRGRVGFVDTAAHLLELPPAKIIFILRQIYYNVVSAALAFMHHGQPVKIRSGKAVYRLIFKFLFMLCIQELSPECEIYSKR